MAQAEPGEGLRAPRALLLAPTSEAAAQCATECAAFIERLRLRRALVDSSGNKAAGRPSDHAGGCSLVERRG